MTKEICFISAKHDFPTGTRHGSRFVRSVITSLAQQLISHETKRLLSAESNADWTGLVSGPVYSSLPLNLRESIFPYNRRHNQVAQNADYRPLHRLADELDSRALALGEESGFCWKGVSVFRLMETRWLHPLLLNYVTYAEMIGELLRSRPAATVLTLTSNSFCERIASRVAQNRCHQHSSIGARLLSWIQGTEELPRQAYREMLTHWRRYSADKARMLPIIEKKRPRIAFVAYKERSLRRLEILAPRLVRELDAEIYLITNFTGHSAEVDAIADQIRRHGVTVIATCESISKDEVNTIADQVNRRVAKAMSSLFAKPIEISYGGIELGQEILPFLEDTAQNGSSVSAIYVEASDRVFNSLDPDLLIHFEEWEPNRALSLRARDTKTETISYYCLSPDHHSGIIRRLSHSLATSGTHLAGTFQATGNWPPEKIEVVGDPIVDRVAKLDRRVFRQGLIDKFHLDSNRPLLLILTSYADHFINEHEHEEIRAQCVNAARNLNAQLIIKVHPQQNPDDMRAAFAALGVSNPIILHQVDLLELAASVDLAIVPLTSAIPQLILAGTPVLSLQPKAIRSETEEQFHFQKGYGMPVLDLDVDPTETCRELLSESELRRRHRDQALRHVIQHVGPLDGKSTERVTQYLRKKLNERMDRE